MKEALKNCGKANRIALYGGAFNPIHNGHLATIGLLLASQNFDQVLVIPSGDRPDKIVGVSAAQRLEMTTLAVAEAFPGDQRVVVSDIHARGLVGYGTIDLIDHFQARPNVACFIVIGHELLSELHAWKESERLLSIARFIVIHRPGSPMPNTPQGVDATTLPSPYPAGVLVSSSTVRNLIAQGLSCAGLVPPSVIRFCVSNGLYNN